MSVEIYIGGSKLDLRPATVVAITKQINSIGEISNRKADFTNRFTVDTTPNNRLIAQYLNIPGNGSTRPYKWASASIVNNGIPVLPFGVAMLLETKNRNSYEFVIYAGNYDLLSKTQGKNITDCDWSDLEHVFNKDSWIAAIGNTDGYIYPISDTLGGRLAADNVSDLRVDLNYQVPHVFVKTIWDKIFTEAGLIYSGDFFTDNDTFKNQTVAAHRNYYDEDTYKYDNLITWNQFGFSVGAFPIDSYTVLKTGRYRVRMDIDIELTDRGAVRYVVKKNGSVIYDEPFISPACTAITERFKEGPEYSDIFYAGDLIEVELYFNATGCGFPNLPAGYLHTTNMLIQINSAYFLNDTINFSNTLPEIAQVDFLKAIMQQYGLLYQVRPDGAYVFSTIEDVLNGVMGFEDYSSKLSRETSETYEQTYFNESRFEYKYDDEDKISGKYADSSFAIDADNIQKDGAVVSSIIKAAGDYYQYDNWQEIAQLFTFKNTETDPTKPPIYELQDNNDMVTTVLNRTHTVTEIILYDSYEDSTKASLYSTVIPVAQFKDLHWQELTELYYPKFIEMVQTPVKKNVALWLTPIDIYFLDLFKIVYFEQYQSFFYINKINNFVSGKLSDTEILKIN